MTQFCERGGLGLGHRRGSGVFFKQGWRDHVHPLIGALSRENRRHEKLVGIAMFQGTLGLGVLFVEFAENPSGAADGLRVQPGWVSYSVQFLRFGAGGAGEVAGGWGDR